MASISYFATAKRSACDRCKKQKLRCPPQLNHKAGQPCGRCARADVPCIKGYTRPRGFSARSTGEDGSSQRLSISSSQPSSGQTRTTESRSRRDPTDTMLDMNPTAGDTSSLLWFLGNDGGQYLPPLNPHDIRTDATNDEDNLTVSDFDRHLLPEDYHDDIIESFEVSAPESSLPRRVAKDPNVGSQRVERQRQSFGENAHFCRMPRWTECDMRLCQLNLDLCKQLDRQIHPSLETTTGAQRGLTGTNGCSTFGDAFGDALNNTEKYLEILQDLLGGSPPSASSSSTKSPSIRSEDDVHIPSNLVCILGLESCYFRIVNLFNLHLANMHEQSRQGSHDPDTPSLPLSSPVTPSSPPVLPGLRLAGFLVRQAGLQAKILFQVIQHQFEMIEKLLGLPSELRVSGRRDEDDDLRGVLCEFWVTTSLMKEGRACDEQIQAIQVLRERIVDAR